MTDFFENVAARARGEALAVRPRLPSLFESAPAQELEQTVDVFATAEARPQPSVLRPAHIPGRVPEVPPRQESPHPDISVPAAEPLPAALPSVAPIPVPNPEAAKVTVETSVSMLAMTPSPNPFRSATPPPAPVPAAPHLRREVPPPSAGQRREPPPAPQDNTADAYAAALPSTDRPQVLVPPSAAPPPALVSLQRQSPQPIVPRVGRSRFPQTLPSSAPQQEETTVHVSIGRIEVRAVQPPADGKRREQARSAVMSLDEYLRSRREQR
jgi:hypothetical protein